MDGDGDCKQKKCHCPRRSHETCGSWTHTVTGFLSWLAALSLSFPSVTCAVVSSGCHRRLDDFHQNSMSSYITFNVTFTISATIYTMANFDIWHSSSNVETLPLRSYPLNYRNRASFWLLMSTIMAVWGKNGTKIRPRWNERHRGYSFFIPSDLALGFNTTRSMKPQQKIETTKTKRAFCYTWIIPSQNAGLRNAEHSKTLHLKYTVEIISANQQSTLWLRDCTDSQTSWTSPRTADALYDEQRIELKPYPG